MSEMADINKRLTQTEQDVRDGAHTLQTMALAMERISVAVEGIERLDRHWAEQRDVQRQLEKYIDANQQNIDAIPKLRSAVERNTLIAAGAVFVAGALTVIIITRLVGAG